MEVNSVQESSMTVTRFCNVGVVCFSVLFAGVESPSADWNQFRGPNRDNISRDTGLLDRWPAGGPERVWTATGFGEGYSAVAVVGSLVYSMGNLDDGEYIIAVDRSTGDVVWKTRNGNKFHNGTGNGPRGTPSVADGKVYGLGGNGDLTCCNADTGAVIWQKNILAEFGGSNITWGISESVLIDDGKVICTPGGSRDTVVALNKDTGSTRWVSRVPESPRAAYASPVVAQVDQTKLYIVFTSKGVVGIRAADGEPLWGQNKSSNDTANCATPLVTDRYIFSSSDYGTGAELIEVSPHRRKVRSRVVYHNRNMKNHHGGMVYVDGHVYGSSGDILTCINLRSGKPTWRQRSMKGSVVSADGKIVFRHENGRVVLLQVNSDAYRELGHFQQQDRSDRPAWSHPVIAGGYLYLRDQDKLLVYNLLGS